MKNEERLILGEIGFKHEVDLFRNDPDNYENILYYPNEYFNEEKFDKIFLSFDIWSLGVVFWEIFNQKKLFTDRSQILDENFIKKINFTHKIEELILK